jgi:hypothetical protein
VGGKRVKARWSRRLRFRVKIPLSGMAIKNQKQRGDADENPKQHSLKGGFPAKPVAAINCDTFFSPLPTAKINLSRLTSRNARKRAAINLMAASVVF